LDEINQGHNVELPVIKIELYIKGENLARFEGRDNSERINSCGLFLKIHFDEKYQLEYEELVKSRNIRSLPIEYYDVEWKSFAQEELVSKNIPMKSAFIDSSSFRYQNGSDIYISKIVKENLDPNEIVGISQAHRTMRDTFIQNPLIEAINKKIKEKSILPDKKIELSVELLSKNAWENSLMTYLDEIPFHFLGKGEQCVLKTKLALSHKKAKEANIILMEEPENHLT
jgi:putative ATP-dependent endonuclease of OLD family